MLIGHTEGLTHLDSKDDGRYLLSNCKDQTARLWDIRKVLPSSSAFLICLAEPNLQRVARAEYTQHDNWTPSVEDAGPVVVHICRCPMP